MVVGVSIPTINSSLSSANVALWSSTVYMAFGGESLIGLNVSLFTTSGTSAIPPSGSGMVFNAAVNSQYIAVLAGFV